MIFANLLWSALRGSVAGPDPFYGGTLEWTIPSPPPHYNFAVIPTVRSPYPNWDTDDRIVDRVAITRGVDLLDAGHETPVSTVADGALDDVAAMPAESAWPPLLALASTAGFALLLTSHYTTACALFALAGLCLVGWHSDEPEDG
jgi:hypothetical protein